MIRYQTGGGQFLINLFKFNGSVFPHALCFSLPNAIFTGILVSLMSSKYFDNPPIRHLHPDRDSIMTSNGNAVWGGFSFLIGFLVVFRTSQAYSRFWEGADLMHKMGAEWFDACSTLVAFCKHSNADDELILEFQNTLVRLFSMLHAAALGNIEDHADEGQADPEKVMAYSFQLIDPGCVDTTSLETLRDSNCKVELIFQWIQALIVMNIKPGVLSIPPPILSRSFQEIANGMVNYHEAMKITNVLFPFPYAQTCDALLVLHWFMVPFVVSQWVTKFWWAAAFSFVQVFTFWCLSLIAQELENPFGQDANDIDSAGMHLEMNRNLRMLLCQSSKRVPTCVAEEDGHTQQMLVDRALTEPTTHGHSKKTSAGGRNFFSMSYEGDDDDETWDPQAQERSSAVAEREVHGSFNMVWQKLQAGELSSSFKHSVRRLSNHASKRLSTVNTARKSMARLSVSRHSVSVSRQSVSRPVSSRLSRVRVEAPVEEVQPPSYVGVMPPDGSCVNMESSASSSSRTARVAPADFSGRPLSLPLQCGGSERQTDRSDDGSAKRSDGGTSCVAPPESDLVTLVTPLELGSSDQDDSLVAAKNELPRPKLAKEGSSNLLGDDLLGCTGAQSSFSGRTS